jgi:hypothetical protein
MSFPQGETVKRLILKSSYADGPKAKLVLNDEVDNEGDFNIDVENDDDVVSTWINREQAVALIAHLKAVFSLDTPNTNPLIRYED